MKGADVHGRGRLRGSVISNWGAQCVQIASGFVVPRLIDNCISQEALGVWDFAWSVVVYCGLVQIGITGAINRYVAKFRAVRDLRGLNTAVSSVAIVMRCMATLAFIVAVSLTLLTKELFADRLGTHLFETRWLILLLGTNIAVQIATGVYASIITGCHRWDVHNGIQACVNIGTLVGMTTALLCGSGLIGLAVVTLVCEGAGRSARIFFAYRICPGLEISRKLFQKDIAKEMTAFGGKAFVPYLTSLFMNSSVRILLAAHLGPAALALYSRPAALVRSVNTFVTKYAMVFGPTVSSMKSAGEVDGIRELSLKATRYGLFFSLPVICVLAIYGEEIISLWMGPRYVFPHLTLALILGGVSQIFYVPLMTVLVGVNRHGFPAVVNLCAATVALCGAVLSLMVFDFGLLGVAVAVGVPMTLSEGVVLPLYACRMLKVSLGEFVRKVWLPPVKCVGPFTVCMLLAFNFKGLPAVGWAILGILLLLIGYWRIAVSGARRARILLFLRQVFNRGLGRVTGKRNSDVLESSK